MTDIQSYDSLPDGAFLDPQTSMWHAYFEGELVGVFHTIDGAAREYTYWVGRASTADLGQKETNNV